MYTGNDFVNSVMKTVNLREKLKKIDLEIEEKRKEARKLSRVIILQNDKTIQMANELGLRTEVRINFDENPSECMEKIIESITEQSYKIENKYK